MLYKTPIHVLVCKVGLKIFILLSQFPRLFWANGQNHIHFRLIQVLKNSTAWHFRTFTSPSSKLEFAGSISPCCSVEEQMLIFSSSLTPGRVNSISKLTVVLIWKIPAYLKFGKISTRAEENLPQRKLRVWTANDTELPRVFIWVVCGKIHSGKKWRSVWLNAMHSGKKRLIREFFPPYTVILRKLSEKVHAIITNGIVGSLEFTVLERTWFERMARGAMDVCLRALKESQKK